MWWLIVTLIVIVIIEGIVILSFISADSFREEELNGILNALNDTRQTYLNATKFNDVGE